MPGQTVLDAIVAHKREELEARKRAVPLAELKARGEERRPPLDLAAALRPGGRRDGSVRLIAEVKRASPSRGVLRADLDPAAVAAEYVRNGAAAISVLTDSQYFGGSLDDLRRARSALAGLGAPVPLLRKDFILDPYQIVEGHAYGADAVLLIVAALPDDLLASMLATARDLGMEALVEVHDEGELQRALALEPRVVGINSRDLRDLSVDMTTFARLAPALPTDVIAVAESGVRTAADVEVLAGLGADAVLVGEALVTAPDIGARVREFASVRRPAVPRKGDR